MKTRTLILALGLSFIFANGFAATTAPKALAINNPDDNRAKSITYVVRVENQSYLQAGAHYVVGLTDGAGNLVAPAQLFVFGTSEYTFHEAGTVVGTRVARMVKLPARISSSNIPPVSQTGTFFGGSSYLFILKPNAAELNNWGTKQ